MFALNVHVFFISKKLIKPQIYCNFSYSTHKYPPDMICLLVVCMHSYTSAMNFHFEFVKVEPVSGFVRVQVMVAVSCCKAKTVEAQVRGQEQAGRALLIGHAWIPTLPSPVEIGR